MGTFDDSTPKVRPLGDETPPPTPGRRTIIGAVMVLAIAGAIFLNTGPTQTPTDGVALPPLPTTSSTSSTSLPAPFRDPDEPSVSTTNLNLALSVRMAELLDDANAIWDVLPDADGEFVAVIAGPAGTDLIQLSRDSATVQLDRPIRDWQSLAFDQSGQHLAYIGDSPVSDGPALYVESDTSVPIRDSVASFAWHATIPGRIAWHELKTEELCWVDVGGPEEPATPQCVPGPEFGTRLVGFDDNGFIGIDNIGGTVSRSGFDGRALASVTGEYAWPRPTGDVLIATRDRVNNRTTFFNVDAYFASPTSLDWVPTIRTDEPILVAVSPSVAYPEIAFVTWQDRQAQLDVFDSDGELTHTIAISGWVSDIDWDSTGRYLLIPGTLGTEQVLHIYDAYNSAIITTSFGGYVQQAVLVTPVFCEDASPSAASLSRRMPADITLLDAQLVKSRDTYLLSFAFLSAEVIGGQHNGDTATWAVFGPEDNGETSPINVMALNEPAKSLNLDNLNIDGNIDWMHIDGAIGSQMCVTGPPPLAPVLP